VFGRDSSSNKSLSDLWFEGGSYKLKCLRTDSKVIPAVILGVN